MTLCEFPLKRLNNLCTSEISSRHHIYSAFLTDNDFTIKCDGDTENLHLMIEYCLEAERKCGIRFLLRNRVYIYKILKS